MWGVGGAGECEGRLSWPSSSLGGDRRHSSGSSSFAAAILGGLGISGTGDRGFLDRTELP